MPKVRNVTVLLVTLAFSAAAFAEIPSVLYEKGDPVWISSAVLEGPTAKGLANLPRGIRDDVASMVAKARTFRQTAPPQPKDRSPCDFGFTIFPEYTAYPSLPSDLLHMAGGAIVGEVVDIDVGWPGRGLPATLLEIRPTVRFRFGARTKDGTGHQQIERIEPLDRTVYLIYQQARIPVEDVTLCQGTFAPLSQAAAGAQVLVFLEDRDRALAMTVLEPRESMIIIQSPDGEILKAPSILEQVALPADLTDLIELLSRIQAGK